MSISDLSSDVCWSELAAIQVALDVEAGKTREVVVRLGAGRTNADALAILRETRGRDTASDALDEVRISWLRTLGAVQVETPEPAVDLLANGWLLYQTIGCRYFARSRSEEHTSELQSLMRISYAVFCLKKKK